MPARSPRLSDAVAERLAKLGRTIRARRKALGVNAVTVAETTGMSRPTVHRIERGEASVTIGAYLGVMQVLGLDLKCVPSGAPPRPEAAIPIRIRLLDYPVLQQLAWQLKQTEILTPREALDIYERNRRHVDDVSLDAAERQLIEGLRQVFSDQAGDV